MKIVYLLGNGFDLSLGMKTGYKDFYEYYQSTNSKSEVVKKLKDEISGDLENWSDLELAFGKYTEKINSQDEYDELIEDLLGNLGEYLCYQEEKLDVSILDREKFCNYLAYPEESLLQADKNKLKAFRNNYKNSRVSIVTFNYTRVVEKIIGEKYSNIQITTHQNGGRSTLSGVEHIHGYTDRRMILGVNDISQIQNKSFHNNTDVLESLVKRNCNKVLRHTRDSFVENQINSANLICIYGSSIGDTDKVWWELIGERLRSNVKLIIFVKDKPINPLFEYKSIRIERKIVENFLTKTNLEEKEKEKVKDNIFIGLNTQMFNIKSTSFSESKAVEK
ncbi:AbiH family protein [Echinicola shivajiensis]|uniref:AbiH family protein n=1 Tax=Echinicola shivajiensis TaxID=1035916 RepID=UPI001BFC9E39|nr:AbiH family protein [Echinicola shivajiensis]